MQETRSELIAAADVKIGDTVIIHGNMVTVGKENLKRGFMGTTIRGERFDKIQVVLFPRWYKGQIVEYARCV